MLDKLQHKQWCKPALIFGLTLIITAVATVKLYEIDDRVYAFYLDQSTPDTVKQSSVWLNDYAVNIDTKVINGISHNTSGITWNPITGTLFGVINNPPQVFELNLDGELLRLIELTGFDDVEAIRWV